MKCTLVLCVSLVLTSLVCGEDYWMRPNISAKCPQGEKNCITLSDMIADSSKFNHSNLTIHLLPGVHQPNQRGWIKLGSQNEKEILDQNKLLRGYKLCDNNYSSCIHNLQHNKTNNPEQYILSFIGHPNYCDKNDCDIVIQCKSFNFGIDAKLLKIIYFSNLSKVSIKQCGLPITHAVKDFNTTYVSAALVVLNVESLSLDNVHISNSTGYGLFAIEPVNTAINNCSFMFNNWNTLETAGGNIFIHTARNTCAKSKLNISDSTISYGREFNHQTNGKTDNSELLESVSGGLTVVLVDLPTNQRGIDIHISSTYFSSNFGLNGGNIYINFTGVVEKLTNWGSCHRLPIIIIDNCIFERGHASKTGGGLYIDQHHEFTNYIYKLEHQIPETLVLNITNSKFFYNSATNGGAVAITHGKDKKFFKILRLRSIQKNPMKFTITNCTIASNTAATGAGIYHSTVHKLGYNYYLFVAINSLLFMNNTAIIGGAMYINVSDTSKGQIERSNNKPGIFHFKISQCNYISNIAMSGSAISIINPQSTSIATRRFSFEISGVRISYNKGWNTTLFSRVVYLEHVQNISIINVTLDKNGASAMCINASKVEFHGNISFISNSAQHGAAIFLDCTPSQFILADNTRVYIANNTATTYGGGIAVRDGCSLRTNVNNYVSTLLCFFQIKGEVTDSPQVIMKNNKAGVAGDDIYGGDLEYCRLNYINHNSKITRSLTRQNFTKIFKLDSKTTAVSSRPHRVCLCNNGFDQKKIELCTLNLSGSIFPGEEFTVPIVGVGQFNYPSPAVIRAEANTQHGYQVELGERQSTQDIRRTCNHLTYSLHTKAKQAILLLSVDIPLFKSNLLTVKPIIISITVLDCPFGFELEENNSSQYACGCAAHLKAEGLPCDINTRTIYREASMWIGNFSDDIVIHHNCPFDYCTQHSQKLNIYNQGAQCNFNRSVVLCGACKQGLSLALGTSQCLECTNTYLLLLFPFALAGIFLVLLLLKCDLTVSAGTINGLIFYANIVQANRVIFFPLRGTKFLSYFLSIFIAWLNLDLGFEVCFTDGLDAYTRTWLQFLFPLYIWILVGLLILVCRYSVTVSRMTGSNTVSVLATLFLLSYAKLLQTTLNIFSFTTLTGRNSILTHVWLIDGNYPYLYWPHSALIIAALLTLIAHAYPTIYIPPTVSSIPSKVHPLPDIQVDL